MFSNTNAWRRFNYTLLAPVYDGLARALSRLRARSLQLAAPRAGERVLLLGAGTGLDLHHLPAGLDITAIDLTPAMVRRLQHRAGRLGLAVDARVMDGMNLALPEASFDLVVLHLVLSVIPDAPRCLAEAARVLKPGGRAILMDKFAPDGCRPWALRLASPLMSLLGTNLDRPLAPMLAGGPWSVVSDQSAGLGGYYRIVLLRRT